ncbi:MAG: MBOAT family O-acyltransferase, partial [Anaerolineales bacterium]
LAMFWLQPATPVRYLEYWLPALTVGIILTAYAVIYQQKIFQKENRVDLILLVVGLLVVAGLRFFGTEWTLTSTSPPQISSVLVFVVILIGLITFSAFQKGKKVYISILIILILLIFVFLKNIPLSTILGAQLRDFTGQDPGLASPVDVVWLGYSYFAFRLVHILRDKQNNRLSDFTLGEFVSFLIFFPAFTAGPIDRIQNFVKKMQENVLLNADQLIAGAERLAVGIFKKFVLADSLALIALSPQNASQIQETFWGWVILYGYAFRILLDFSGYTDIAIGIGLLAGIRLPENFNKPYLQKNLTEFWNNWHITLTMWFRAYFFNPLTRAMRTGKVNLSMRVIIFVGQIGTMVLIGLWHGIAWNFVVWGAWHGIGLFLDNRFRTWMKEKQPVLFNAKTENKAWRINLGRLVSFHYVALGWIWFVLPSVQTGWNFFRVLFGGGS